MNNRVHTACDSQALIKRCLDILAAAPSGRLMLGEALDDGWQIDVTDLEHCDYSIDREKKLLKLDSHALDAPRRLRPEGQDVRWGTPPRGTPERKTGSNR